MHSFRVSKVWFSAPVPPRNVCPEASSFTLLEFWVSLRWNRDDPYLSGVLSHLSCLRKWLKKCTISDLYCYYCCLCIQPTFNLRPAFRSSQETNSVICIKRLNVILNGVNLRQEEGSVPTHFPVTAGGLRAKWSGYPDICTETFLLWLLL